MTESPKTTTEAVAFAQQIAEDMADEHGCSEAPPCGDDCACWKEALADVRS